MKRYHTGLDILKRFQKRGQATGTFGCPFFMNLSLTSKRDIFGVEEKENELLQKQERMKQDMEKEKAELNKKKLRLKELASRFYM